MLGQGKGLCGAWASMYTSVRGNTGGGQDILLTADQDNSVPQSSKLKAPSLSVTGVTVALPCVYLLPFCGLSVSLDDVDRMLAKTPSLPPLSYYVFLLPSSWCTLVMEQVHFQPVSL